MKITTRAALWGARRMAKRKLRKNRGKLLMAAGGVGAAVAAGMVVRRLTMADLKGQVVLITGGSRGLGFLLAREFARQGCRVVICARDETELERARFDLERQGADVFAVQCDVTDPSQVELMVQKAKARFGQIDILVNNAGTIQVGPFESMTAQDFEDAMRVMFWGVLYPILTVLPDMMGRQSGRIVNITSIGGKVSMPHLLAVRVRQVRRRRAFRGIAGGTERQRHSRHHHRSGADADRLVPERVFQGAAGKRVSLVQPGCGAAAHLHGCEAGRAPDCGCDATRAGRARAVAAGQSAGGFSWAVSGTDSGPAGAGEPPLAAGSGRGPHRACSRHGCSRAGAVFGVSRIYQDGVERSRAVESVSRAGSGVTAFTRRRV